MTKINKDKRIPIKLVKETLEANINDPALIEWGTAKPTNRKPGVQRDLITFILWAGYKSPSELIKAREDEMVGKAARNGIRKKLRAYRDTYIMRICKGCNDLLSKTAEWGKVETCPKCGGKTLAPKSRTNAITNVESFFTNTIGPQGKVMAKGELNKESDDTVTQKYAINLDTVDTLARVADTKEKAFLFINVQTGMDGADIQNYKLTSQDVEVINDPEKTIWVMYHMPRRKETGRGGKPYKNALCGEGLDAYRAYFRKERLGVGSPLVKGKAGQPLESQMMRIYLKNLKDKSGIDVQDLRLDLKTLRSFAFTALTSAQNVMCQGNDFGKFCTGKKVDPSIHTYLIAHDEEIVNGYRSIMEKLNPNMAKYQETVDLKDQVINMAETQIKLVGMIENLQRQVTALENGRTGMAQEFRKEAESANFGRCEKPGCECKGAEIVKGPDGLPTCPSTLKQTRGGGGPTSHITTTEYRGL